MDDDRWPWFEEQIQGKELDYHWFIVDWHTCRNDTRISIAQEGGRLAGALLIFRGRICQMRGESQAAEALLAMVGEGVTEMVMPLEWVDLMPARLKVKRMEEILLMSLEKGSERLIFVREPERLGPWDLNDLVALLHEADRITWGEVTAASLADSVATGAWYGIRQNGRVVAVAGSWMKGDPKHVNIVAVSKQFRGHGYARSVLSRLLEDIFQESDKALINVRADNMPALRAYKALGFVPRLTYCRAIMV
ncbi:MAG: FR47-like protein [Methanomassiliicoccales archaeon PtaU1.Bin124]|nr:MAG: FR47-like protein [Methanomassiliicoccales archaeon PtaU1.Bin124]